jgi:hypothetical protein
LLQIAVSSEGLILTAAVDSKLVRVVDGQTQILSETPVPASRVFQLGFAGGIPLIGWGEEFKATGGGLLVGGTLSEQIAFEDLSVECKAMIADFNILAMGTLDGTAVLGDVGRRSVKRVSLPEPERIVELHWSSHQRRLFAGTRHGSIYCLSVK